MLLSAAMMLDWLAVRHADAALADGARAIEAALEAAFASGAVRPRDFGGQQQHRRHRARGGGAAVTAARIAVVGAGYFAAFHLEGWQAAGAPGGGPVRHRSGAPAEALARASASGGTYTDLQTCWTRPNPDAGGRGAAAAAQARGGQRRARPWHPGDLPEALRPTGAGPFPGRPVRAAGTPLVVHENFRFTPWFRECRRLIDAGHFGRLHGISFRLRPGDGQGRGPTSTASPTSRQMPQLLVRETAVHFIDTFRYLMGEVRAVTARLRRLNPVIAGEDAGSS
jgi:D-apiose dehydrogenase